MGGPSLSAPWLVLHGHGATLADSLLTALGYPLNKLDWLPTLDNIMPPVPRAALAQARLITAWDDPVYPVRVLHLHLRHPIPFRRVCEPFYKKMAQAHYLFVLTAEHRRGRVWLGHARANADPAVPWRLITLRADQPWARRYLADLRLTHPVLDTARWVEQYQRVFWQWDSDRWHHRRSHQATDAPDLLQLYFQDIRLYPVLSEAETRRLFADYAQGGEAAHAAGHALMAHNQRLVFHLARRYQNLSDLSLLDLVQSGNLGLLKAIDKFNPALGYQFSTYAHTWIRQAIRRAIADTGRMVRLPTHVHEAGIKANRVWDAWYADFGRDPTPEELAILLEGWTDHERAELWWHHLHRLAPPAALEKRWRANLKQARKLLAWLPEPERHGLLETLPEETLAEVENAVMHLELRTRLEEAMQNLLQPRHINVLKLRYGWEEVALTLEEIGQRYGLTRERARQIEARALRGLHTLADELGMSPPKRNHRCDLPAEEMPPVAPPSASVSPNLWLMPLSQWVNLSPAERRHWLIAHEASQGGVSAPFGAIP